MADSGTYDQATLLRRQKVADAMLADSRKAKPIRNWAEGVAQVADAGVAGYFSNKVDQETKASKAAELASLMTILNGGATPTTPTSPAETSGQLVPTPAPITSSPLAPVASAMSPTPAVTPPVNAPRAEVMPSAKVWGDKEAEAAGLYEPSKAAPVKVASTSPTVPVPQAPVAQAMTPPQMPAPAQPSASGSGVLINATPQQKAAIAVGLQSPEGSPARAIAMSMMTQIMKPQGYERLNDSTLYDPRTGKTLSVPEAEKSIPLGKDQRLVKDGKVIVDQQPDKAVKITLGNGQEVTAIQNPDGSFKLPEVKGSANIAPKLSEGERDQIIKDEDTRSAGESALSAIREARKLNDKAFSGAGAQNRAWIARNSPVDLGMISGGLSREGGKATTQLDNLLTEQALGSMKAIFGGNPTEGERKVLLDLQASSSKSPEERTEILARAEKMMQRRIQMSGDRSKSIREGSYFKPGGGGLSESPSDALKQKYGLD